MPEDEEAPPAEEKPETPPEPAVEEKPDPHEARFKALEERLDKLIAAGEKPEPKVAPPKPKGDPPAKSEAAPAADEKPPVTEKPEPTAYGSRRWFGNR